jgi:hypothetical protein
MSFNLYRLRKLVDGAFDWFVYNLEMFNPFSNETNGTGPDLYRSKAMLELAIMCMYYHQCVEESRDPRVEYFISFVHDIWQRPEYQERVVRNPDKFRLYVMTYIALLRCSSVDRSYCEIIQRILDQGYVIAIENIPFRVLETRLMLDSCGFRHNLPPYEYLYQETLLAKAPPLLYLADDDVYAITHTLFYLTDFGLHPITVLPVEHLPTVRWMISTLLGIYLCQRNWDLVGELLLNCRCLGWAPPLVFDVAWDSLLNAQLPDGSVPGPKYSKEKQQQLNGLEQRNYCFRSNYHTTLVAALACFLSDQWIQDNYARLNDDLFSSLT